MGQVTSLIRSLLNDLNSNVFTDAVLLPYVNSAYRSVQRKVANAGGSTFITDDVLFVIKAIPMNQQDPETQVVLNDAGIPPNQLPSNLINPLKLWERPNPLAFPSSQEFCEMTDLTNKGGLPSRIQGATLDVWEWRTDGIYFIGATQETQIRLRYNSAFPDLTGPGDVILIRNAQEAIAFAAAAEAGGARGSPLAEGMDNRFLDAVEDVIVANVRAQQNNGTRRRPFSSRRRGSYGQKYY